MINKIYYTRDEVSKATGKTIAKINVAIVMLNIPMRTISKPYKISERNFYRLLDYFQEPGG